MSLPSICAIVVVTAGSCFMLGAFYQHHDVLRRIQKLERRNPHAYFIRRKLYGLLGIFSTNTNIYETLTNDASDSHKLGTIMKYGFPSMNDIRLKCNYVTSFDRRNSAIHWMCEHLQSFESKIFDDKEDTISAHINGSRQLIDFENKNNKIRSNFHAHQSVTQSEASRVFFMSNIKPFLSQGFNTSLWSKLQVYIHDMTEQYGSVYVYTGSIYLPKENDRHSWYLEYQAENTSMVAIPTHFYKIVIVDPQKSHITPYAEAFVLPNSPLSDNLDLSTFLSDVRDIENSTGLLFFDGLERNFVSTQVEPPSTTSIATKVH